MTMFGLVGLGFTVLLFCLMAMRRARRQEAFAILALAASLGGLIFGMGLMLMFLDLMSR